MNEQDASSNRDQETINDRVQNKKSTVDSHGSSSSSSSSSCSPIKIIIDNHKCERTNELNSPIEPNNECENARNESDDELTSESKNETSANEQRTSVIVQPSSTNKSPTNDLPKDDDKPRFLCASKLSQSVINHLFNSSIQQQQDQSASHLKLRPSVLRVGESSSVNVNESGNEESKESKKENLFKFAPLTDKKKSMLVDLGSSITTNAPKVISTSKIGNKEAGTKSSFLNDNWGNDTSSQSTNYFTENLFQQAATQSTSKNAPESSTFSSLASSNSESTGFVFGQNLEERVTNVIEKPKSTIEPGISQVDSAITNATHTNNHSTAALSSSTGVPEKRKFENITGEEEETNVIHIYCKLFHWDTKSSSWKERGKGNLRLNDKHDVERTISRLIMRTAGSYKLILNCLIISGMKFELTNNCIRFSNVDGIYLVKGKQMDIEQTFSLIQQRLKMLPKKSRADIIQEEEDETIENSFKIKEKLKLTKDEDESRDAGESNDDSSFRTNDELNRSKDDEERDTSNEIVENEEKDGSEDESKNDQES